MAAIVSSKKPEGYVFTEEDWNTDSTLEREAYRLSKYLAEKAAVEFADGKKFELIRICPSFVVGPPLSKRTDGSSVALFKAMLEGKFYETGAKPSCYGVVDVRDVADVHVAAAENKEAKGRYIMSSSQGISHLEFAQLLAKSGKFNNCKLPTKESSPSKRQRANNSKVQKELGIKLSSPEEAILEMCQSLIEMGIVEAV
eukprot:TRINITY_DN2829_c0_g1_i2.p1 TRINITY_DN2829_c0_g1~~TRINITY_DN2829_c0_g1_i2.p1  ORF type:complete len:199 (-),score=57.71 TRINITY_DN2829_c0_g1_i2:155-751(-)